MISVLHLLWIVPLTASLSLVLVATLTVGTKLDEINEERHGQWEQSKDYPGFCTCSQCHDCYVEPGWIKMKKWNYCPTCGAKMKEVRYERIH